MFLIWGGGHREKETKYFVADICDQCGTIGKKGITKTYFCGTIFFIPVIVCNKKYFVSGD